MKRRARNDDKPSVNGPRRVLLQGSLVGAAGAAIGLIEPFAAAPADGSAEQPRRRTGAPAVPPSASRKRRRLKGHISPSFTIEIEID
jgi:hypothetical protein